MRAGTVPRVQIHARKAHLDVDTAPSAISANTLTLIPDHMHTDGIATERPPGKKAFMKPIASWKRRK